MNQSTPSSARPSGEKPHEKDTLDGTVNANSCDSSYDMNVATPARSPHQNEVHAALGADPNHLPGSDDAFKYNPLKYLELPWKARNPYVIAAIATMGGLLFGFAVSSVSAFIGQPYYQEQYGNPGAIDQAGITAAIPAGAFIGSLCSGWLSNKMGRRPVIQIAAFMWIIGAIIQACANNVVALVWGRLISGSGVGLASSQVPMYIAELSPDNIRGRLVGMFQWSVNWGIMIMFYISFGCTYMNNIKGCRTAWAIQVVPGLCLLLGTTVLNESPRWLASKGRWNDVMKILKFMYRTDDPENQSIVAEMDKMRREVAVETHSKTTFWDLFNKHSIRRTHTGIFAMIWQQLCGVNAILYYIVNVFTMAGYSGNALLTSSSIQYVILVVCTLPAILWMDAWGRRYCLMMGGIGMMAFLAAQAGLLGKYGIPTGPEGFEGNEQVRIVIPLDQKAVSKASIAVSYLFIACYAPSWGPCGWVYVSEIFPMEQRAYGNAICTAFNWIFNFAISMFTPAAFISITWKTYVIYAVFCLCMALHVFFFFPETRQRSLEEVEAMWESGVPAWKSASWKPDITPTQAHHENHGIEEKRVPEASHHDEKDDKTAIHLD